MYTVTTSDLHGNAVCIQRAYQAKHVAWPIILTSIVIHNLSVEHLVSHCIILHGREGGSSVNISWTWFSTWLFFLYVSCLLIPFHTCQTISTPFGCQTNGHE